MCSAKLPAMLSQTASAVLEAFTAHGIRMPDLAERISHFDDKAQRTVAYALRYLTQARFRRRFVPCTALAQMINCRLERHRDRLKCHCGDVLIAAWILRRRVCDRDIRTRKGLVVPFVEVCRYEKPEPLACPGRNWFENFRHEDVKRPRVELFDIDRKWGRVVPFLNRPEALYALDVGMECWTRAFGGTSWNRKRGPWRYSACDYFHGRRCPKPNSSNWYRCWSACHWLAPWNCVMGQLVMPEFDWHIYRTDWHSTAVGRLGTRRVIFDILLCKICTAGEIFEEVVRFGRRRSVEEALSDFVARYRLAA